MKIIWAGGGVLLLPTLGGTDVSKDLGDTKKWLEFVVLCDMKGTFIWIVFRGYLFCFLRFSKCDLHATHSLAKWGCFVSSTTWFWWWTFCVLLQRRWYYYSWMSIMLRALIGNI